MRQNIKECTIAGKRYRIMKCENCGKIFNAYENGATTSGILYGCIELGCRSGNGCITPVSKEEAYQFIKTALGKKISTGWVRNQLNEAFEM